MKRLLLASFIFLNISLLSAYAQKEAYNWMCGDTFGLSFNTKDKFPVMIQKPIYRDTLKHSPYILFYLWDYGTSNATISDSMGNYLFHSYHGLSVWNKENKMIHSLKDIGPDTMLTQYSQWYFSGGNYIVRKPGSSNLYYNFFSRTEKMYDYTSILEIRPCYHIIDMDMNSGAGGMKQSDVFFHHKRSFVVPARHANNKDVWIIAFGYQSDTVYSYLLTENGLDTNHPVISTLNSKIIIHPYHNDWNIKVSPKGDLLVFPYKNDTLHLFNFDMKTGKLSNRSSIFNFNQDESGSVEFSPDGSKLYAFTTLPDKDSIYSIHVLMQYDLLNNFKTSIIDTLKKDYFSKYGNSLQLAPGGRIICNEILRKDVPLNSKFISEISIIKSPNKAGKACNFQKKYIEFKREYNYTSNGYYLDNKFNAFPTLLSDYINFDILAKGPASVCQGDTIFLTASVSTDDSVQYYWTGPAGFSSNKQNPVITNARPEMSGDYIASYEFEGYSGEDTIHIEVVPLPDSHIEGNVNFCMGDSTTLTAYTSNINCSYIWSTGDTTESITVSKAGKYILKVENSNGCRASDTVDVTVSPLPQAEIEGATTICEGDSTVLSSKYSDSGYKYSWSTGETTKDITVRNSGTYILIIENESGCRAADTAIVNVVPSITPKITTSNGKASFCEGETIKLISEPKGNGYTYLWSTGQTTPDIEINKEGSYSVTISLNGKCEGTNSIDIKVNPKPVVNIEGPASICPGSESALRADKPYSSYSWSTGETTREIKVTKPGSYSVTVTDTNGCSASASIDIKESDVNLTGLIDIDFGRICSGETAEKEITIKNEGTDSVNISDIELQNGTPVFTSPSIKTGPGGVLPNSTLSIKFTFEPGKIGYYKDTVLITTDYPCPVTYTAEIKATSIAKTLVSLPDTTVSIGDNIAIPMKTELVCGNSLPPDAIYQTEISFNASALLPDIIQESGVTNSGIIAGERVISISGTGTKYIKGQVMLALQDSIPLIIKSFNWNNDLIENETKNGILRIKGLCQQNLSKVKAFGIPALSITPNPAGSEAILHISGDIKGTVSIGIYTMAGTKLESMKLEKSKNETDINLNLENLSSGIYQLIATMEGITIAEKLIVIK